MASYSDAVLRGMLLEEAILFILSKTGYSPIFKKNGDPSLNDGTSGMEVYGRGAKHQIDAVADFLYTPPFCNPQRLLIEAKFKGNKTGIDIVRNATGVHKDVSEYWVVDSTSGKRIARKRYHYLYAIFSKEAFSKPAQDYAYAQDIFLLPLKRNSLFKPIIDAIDDISFEELDEKPKLSIVREYVRSQLLYNFVAHEVDIDKMTRTVIALLSTELSGFVNVCRSRGYGFITMLDGKFPVFLASDRGLDRYRFDDDNRVRIRVRNSEWFIENLNGETLFTFDLPEEVFDKYQRSGVLTRRQLLNIKANHMSDFYVFISQEGQLNLVRFTLDQTWFDQANE